MPVEAFDPFIILDLSLIRNMITQEKNNLKYFQFNNLSRFKNLNHFSTTRIGGFSTGKLKSFNLGFTVNDNPENVTKNIELLAKTIGIEKSQILSPKQTNNDNIGIVKSKEDIFPETDALITNIPNICIFVRTADCIPILLYDPINRAIASIHSGWKGTVQKISKQTIDLMQKEFSTNPKDLIAGIGPSIGPEVYEIGTDVIELFEESFGENDLFESIKNSNKKLLNLWKANQQILIECGIPENQIEIAEICTYSDSELFFSARRDGVKTGRLATGIILKE